MHTTSTRIILPPRVPGAPPELMQTRRAGPLTALDMPVAEVDILWEGAHPLLEVLALLSVVSVVPAAWFGLMVLMG